MQIQGPQFRVETPDWWNPVTEGAIALRHAWCLPIQKLTKKVTSCCASWVRTSGSKHPYCALLSFGSGRGTLGIQPFCKVAFCKVTPCLCKVTPVILHGVVSLERPGGYLSLDHSGVICRREAEGEGVEGRGQRRL